MSEGTHQLNIQIERQGDVNIVVLTGPVDSATFADFKSAMNTACGRGDGKVLLDCSGLTYMNSRGFGLLSRYHQVHLGAMGRMALCQIDRKLVRTMDLLGLGQTLSIYETREEALGHL